MNRFVSLAVASLVLAYIARPSPIAAQEAAQTGTIAGKVLDERGAAVSGAQVFLARPAIGTLLEPMADTLSPACPSGRRSCMFECWDSGPIPPA